MDTLVEPGFTDFSQIPKKNINEAPLERNCSVGRTISIIGDTWTFMILRECYFGIRRFSQFQHILKIPRTTLSSRLQLLTDKGILHKVSYNSSTTRFDYRLTSQGFGLYSVMVSLIAFGDKWLSGSNPPPVQLFHRSCACKLNPIVACSQCRREIKSIEVNYRNGPGSGWSSIDPDRVKSRHSHFYKSTESIRPSSVARALSIISDRWSFMVVRESFFGLRRFDELQTALGISPNILANRLNKFIQNGILKKVAYQDAPPRFEYKLTAMGHDLFGPFAAMLEWGDQWLSNNKPPLILTHLVCRNDFKPLVVCNHCGEVILPQQVRYEMSYKNPVPL
jgi:DNA-binding HxlR family transcriptional regulator